MVLPTFQRWFHHPLFCILRFWQITPAPPNQSIHVQMNLQVCVTCEVLFWVWSEILSFLAGLGMTSFSGQFCTPYLTIKRIALNDVMTVAKKKSGEKAINFDDRKSFSITITGSRGQLVPSLSGLFVHFQLKACLPYLLACQLLPFQPILYKPTSVGLICTTEIL